MLLQVLRDGLRAVARNWGLVALLLAVNLAVAALLAVPLAARLERDLRQTDSAAQMLYGFDFPWWSEWSDRQQGWTDSFEPRIFGIGLVFRNMELLLGGHLPAGLFAAPEPQGGGEGGGDGGRRDSVGLDPVLLGLGVLYLLVSLFLTGGLLGTFRDPEGGWTVRGLLHGSGFYFGRMLRVALVALAVQGLLFVLYAPLGGWLEHRAAEAVSESAAMGWLAGRHLLLLIALLALQMISSYAKVIVVLEERSSALLAWLSSCAFCARNPGRTAGLHGAFTASVALLLLAWSAADGAWPLSGYKSQLVGLLLAEALIFGRIGLRLGLLASQTALYRRVALPQAGLV